jgi:hypothetical protein
VHGAAVTALAVDDHRRGHHQAAGEASTPQGPQQARRPGVVVVHVAGDVVEIHAQSDPGGLVAHGVHPHHRPRQGGLVLERGHAQVDPGVEVVGRRGVGRRVERVEDDHVGAVVEQGVDDVAADEAGAPRDQHSHVVALRVGRAR